MPYWAAMDHPQADTGDVVVPQHDLIVVGEGFAGLACAQEAATLGLDVAIFESEFCGGLAVNLNQLHGLDEADGRSGVEHAVSLASALSESGVERIGAAVTRIRRAGEAFEIESEAGTHGARAVAIASGARLMKLGINGETTFEGRGVSYCADCDAPMFNAATVVVVGDTEWAAHEALVLAKEAATVYLVHAAAALDARPETIGRLQAASSITLVPGAHLEEILGDDNGVTAVRVGSPAGTHQIACTGVFPMIGLEPASEVAPAELARDGRGALVVDDWLETAQANLFAIGQVRSGSGGWIIDAVADGRSVARTLQVRFGKETGSR